MATQHRSYYINVGQVLGVIGTVYLGTRALKLEEEKAGIERRPITEVIKEDYERVKNWVGDKLYRIPKTYRHF